MTNILTDIKSAVKLTGEIRKARKEGASIEARKVWKVPVIKTGYWGWTMEFCLMRDREMEKAIVTVFDALPEPVQHSLTFTPKKPGEWVERARFWQAQSEGEDSTVPRTARDHQDGPSSPPEGPREPKGHTC